MTDSQILRIIAEANQKIGRTAYADLLNKAAVVAEAEEVINSIGGKNDE